MSRCARMTSRSVSAKSLSPTCTEVAPEAESDAELLRRAVADGSGFQRDRVAKASEREIRFAVQRRHVGEFHEQSKQRVW
jgi:hypothetical protein